MHGARRLISLLPLLALLTGCGPILSTYLIVAAQADLDGAQAAEAERYAVYEFTKSQEFLHKAREEQGYADFGPSIDYAYKAQEFAIKAREKADEEKRKALDQPAEWQEPEEGEQTPSVIIKKKEPGKVRVVPIPTEQPQ